MPMMNIRELWNDGWFSDGKIDWIYIIYHDELIDLVLESNKQKKEKKLIMLTVMIDMDGDYVTDDDEYGV